MHFATSAILVLLSLPETVLANRLQTKNLRNKGQNEAEAFDNNYQARSLKKSVADSTPAVMLCEHSGCEGGIILELDRPITSDWAGWSNNVYNDRISEIVIQKGWKIEVFQNSSFGGWSKVFEAQDSIQTINLDLHGMNNEISSFKVSKLTNDKEIGCGTPSDTYKQSDGILGTSGSGGLCICPSGATYIVADNYDGCQSLQCVGGTSVPICDDPEGNVLNGFQFAAKHNRRGWGVVCDDKKEKVDYVFKRVDEHMSWNDHNDQAKVMGCSLASILNEEEQAKVEELFLDGIDERIWIGASRTGPGISDWEWSDGSPFGYYTNWQEGEPNNPGEDGALMDTRPIGERYWNDVPKKFQYSAVYKCPRITSVSWRIRNASVSSSNAWALRGLQFCGDADCETVYSPLSEYDDEDTPSWSSPSFLFDSDMTNSWKSFHRNKVGSSFVAAVFEEPVSVAAIGIRPDNIAYGISDIYVEYYDGNEGEWKTFTTLTDVPKHYGDINSGGPTYPNDVWYIAKLPGYPTTL